jgi:hypothetical protein
VVLTAVLIALTLLGVLATWTPRGELWQSIQCAFFENKKQEFSPS